MEGCGRLILLIVKLMDNPWLREKLFSRGRSSLITAENYVIHMCMQAKAAHLATLMLSVR